ncbi:hypothetical protein H6P81_021648 [Aristolochia fimbriata]|uniref:NADH dehydrogenase subunit 2 n=1 Tax=Aristolochia fimbriata TaxID=158543 RepID=A0AAV7DTW7_ARIFI|nr:hypothetical protein H6P81_021648 [Aristolochia fimbriata]
MIYGSTGATHFDQLAKILTGYEITGARSSGLFMGILSIAVGSLFKITAVPLRAAVGRTAAYRCASALRSLGKENAFGDRDLLSFSSKTKKAYGACYLKGEENTLFRPRWYDCRALSSFRPQAYWDSSLRALPALSNKEFRLGPGKRWQQKKGRGPCSCCARPLIAAIGQQVRHLLQKRESTSDNHASARQRVEWPRADLFGYIIQVESGVTGTAV